MRLIKGPFHWGASVAKMKNIGFEVKKSLRDMEKRRSIKRDNVRGSRTGRHAISARTSPKNRTIVRGPSRRCRNAVPALSFSEANFAKAKRK